MPNHQFVGYSQKEITGVINSSQVPANRTNFKVLFREGDVPERMIDGAIAEATNDKSTPGHANATRYNIALGVTAADPTKGPWDRIPIHIQLLDIQNPVSNSRVEIWALFPDVFAASGTEHAWFWGGDGLPDTLGSDFGGDNCFAFDTSFYTMDDLTASTLFDHGTNKVNAVQTNAPQPVASDIGFAQNYIASFSEYHTIAGKLGTPSAFTIELWFERNVGGGSTDVFSIADNHIFRIGSGGTFNFTYRSGGVWYTIEVTEELRDGQRHHVVLMGTSGNQRIYLDGVLRDTLTQGAPGYDVGTDTTISKNGVGSSGFMDGDIDNVIFTPIVKNDDYVTTVYNNQKPSSTFITRGTSPEAHTLPTVLKPPIQGVATLGSGVTAVNVAIGSTVDMNLAFLKYTYRTDNIGNFRGLMAGEIFGGNMLQFNVFNTVGTTDIEIEWQVIEYEKDSGVLVQHSFRTMSVASLTVVLPITINPNRSWLTFFPGILNSAGYNGSEIIEYSLQNAGIDFVITRIDALSVYNVTQAISYHNALTQTVAYSSSLATVNVPISTVDVNKSFAYASSKASGFPGMHGNAKVNLAASQVTLEKYVGGVTKSGFIYVITFEDDTIVGVLQFDLSSSTTNQNESIGSVDVAKTFLWDGNSDYQYWPTDDGTANNYDTKNFLISMELDSSTNIRLRRSGAPSIIAKGTIYIISQGAISSALINGGLIEMGLTRKGLVR